MEKKFKLPFGMRAAKIGSEKSQVKDFQVGASLLYRNKIIISWNSPKGSPGAVKWYAYPSEGTHAEFLLFDNSLLEKLPIRGTVYVYRGLANGETGLARPCKSCRNFLHSCGIKKVIYTDYNNVLVEEKLS